MVNAFDLLKSSAMEKMLPGIMDKLLENIPPDVLAQIMQIGQFVKILNARLETIEAQNRLIMDKLGIGTTENGYGPSGDAERSSRAPDGGGS